MERRIVTIALAGLLAGCSTGSLSWVAPGVTVQDIRDAAPRSTDDAIQLARLQVADAYSAAATLLRAGLIDVDAAKGLRTDLRRAEALLAASELALGGSDEAAAKLDLDGAVGILGLVEKAIEAMENRK